jgi:hypothetical protein
MVYIQGNTHQNGAASSLTVAVTLASSVGVGDSVIVSGGIGGSDGTETVTVQDDKGNVYTVRDLKRDSADTFSWWTAFFLNAVNAPQTITATLNVARTHQTIMADEFSNVGAFEISAMSNQVAPGAGTDAVTSGNVTTTSNGDLIYGSSVSINSEGISIGTGFTGAQSPAVSATFITEFKIQGSAGAVAATFTSPGTNDFLTGIMAFKPLVASPIITPSLAASEW